MRDAARRIIRRVGVETGGSNIQFAINPADGRMVVDRDESARVAIVGAGLEGHRLPDRENRGQARVGVSPGRDSQRHHARDPGIVRTDDRLRRRQDPALEFREVPARRSHAHDADEVGRRSRWRSAARSRKRFSRGSDRSSSDATGCCSRARQPRSDETAEQEDEEEDTALRRSLVVPNDRRMWALFRALDKGWSIEQTARAHEDGSVVPRAIRRIGRTAPHRRDGRAARHVARFAAHAQARRVWRPGTRPHPRSRARAACARSGASLGSRRRSSASTHAPPNSNRSRRIMYSSFEDTCEAEPTGAGEDRHSRQRAQSHRARHRVRLLLLSRGLRLPSRRASRR